MGALRSLNSLEHCLFGVIPFLRGDRLYTPESVVCRRQILTYKDDPRTESIKLFVMIVDP